MKVIARHWLNYNGVWHKAGEEFEVNDIEEVKEYVDPIIDFQVPLTKEPAKRGRPKKTED